MTIYKENIALGIQAKLLENFIDLVHSSNLKVTLKATLQKTVDLSTEIAKAEGGSLFLINHDGVVTDCIMMREMPNHEDGAKLIGSVLDKGLAGWVVKHREVGLIYDTRHDNRWLDLPNQPYTVRSALVTPILKRNSLFGILSLAHSKPDQFSDETASLLKATANHIAVVLENARLYDALNEAFHKLESAKKTIEIYSNALTAELEKGRHMQRTFLPTEMPIIQGWKIEACLHPAKQVSGDFYDMFPIGEEHLGIILADVCDKGVSAALFMGIFRSLIHAYLEPVSEIDSSIFASLSHQDQTMRALLSLNKFIQKHHGKEGIFATMFFGVLNIFDGRLDYINAGHEPVMVIDPSRNIRELFPTGPAIGISSDSHYDLHSCNIEHGETVIGFTDGITDARSKNDTRFCRSGIRYIIQNSKAFDNNYMQCIIESVFNHIGGSDLTDDIAMISFCRL